MNKVIWICWFQGWKKAPYLVRKCIISWEKRNTGWQICRLDKHNLHHYIDIPDLSTKEISHAAFSDIVRILLLKRYGGVWVDATLYCNKPLDDWLLTNLDQGFFAFANPGPGRPIASWFIASHKNNYIVERWHNKTLCYWLQRNSTSDYFWFHHLFKDLLSNDKIFRNAFAKVPKISADGPHAIQRVGIFETDKQIINNQIDWQTMVFKLTHRFDESLYRPDILLWKLLESEFSSAD
jgi:hypothetical protein